MAINKQNLKVPTSEEARRNGSKGGKASVEARKRKKELRECLEILLEREIKAKNGETLTGAEAIALKQFEKALRGDTKAFEVVRDTAGQKPVERVQMTEVDQTTIDEVEKLFNDENASD